MNTRPRRLPASRIMAPDGRPFPWGPIQKIHTVGDIKIVEYLNDRSAYTQNEYWHEHGTTGFHPYVNDRDTSHSFTNLDSAVIYAIARKRCEINDAGYVAQHFDRMTLNGDQS